VRLKQNEFVQLEDEIWLQLKALGLIPGTALYLNGVSVQATGIYARSMWHVSGSVNIGMGTG